MNPLWTNPTDPRRPLNPDLTSFLLWFLEKHPIGSICPPEGPGTLHCHESVLTFCLFRKSRWQVELIILLPKGPPWPGEHRHPNVDSYEVAWYNSVNFTRNGVICNEPDVVVPVLDPTGRHVMALKPCVRLLPTDFHGTPSLELGGALLSVQCWLNDVPPTSVGLDWIGEPTTDGHKKQLEERGNSATK